MTRFDRAWAIATKDWRELSRNKTVLITIFLPALLFIIVPIAFAYFVPAGAFDDEAPPELRNALAAASPQFAAFTDAELGMVLILSQMLSMLLIVPMMVPMVIATYAVIGEKQGRTLEPLLAAPITTGEILLGKAIAAVLPGIIVCWLTYGVMIAALVPRVTPGIFAFMTSPTWLLAIVFVGPALTLLAVNLAVIVSSRVNDPRAAQQAGVVVILPIVGLGVAQISGAIFLTPTIMVGIGLVILLLGLGALGLAIRVFDRESILTRWQ